jgi:hypothetical protein
VHPDGASTLLAGISGVVFGGLLARLFSESANVVIGIATVTMIVCATFAALTGRDVTRTGAIGGGVGLAIGVAAAVLDALFL